MIKSFPILENQGWDFLFYLTAYYHDLTIFTNPRPEGRADEINQKIV